MTTGPRIASIQPTVFFVRGASGDLRQLCGVAVENPVEPFEGTLVARAGGVEIATSLGRVARGSSVHQAGVPDLGEEVPLRLVLHRASGSCDEMTLPWSPVRHWECHLVHGSHHDLGYTDLPSNVLREHASYLDRVIELCEQTDSWPEESRFRFVVEQAWSALYHLENRPPQTVERMLRLMRSGRVEVTALFANETSELCGHEEQVRLLYPSFRLARLHGIPIQSAELNDIPGVSWGLAGVLAGAGVRYFAPGSRITSAGAGERCGPIGTRSRFSRATCPAPSGGRERTAAGCCSGTGAPPSEAWTCGTWSRPRASFHATSRTWRTGDTRIIAYA